MYTRAIQVNLIRRIRVHGRPFLSLAEKERQVDSLILEAGLKGGTVCSVLRWRQRREGYQGEAYPVGGGERWARCGTPGNASPSLKAEASTIVFYSNRFVTAA